MFAIETQYTLNLEPIYFQTYFKYTSNVNPTYNNDAHNIHPTYNPHRTLTEYQQSAYRTLI